MTSQVLSLTRLEWFKLRHRRMPWILLGITVLLVQVAFWSSYALFRSGQMTAGEVGEQGSVSVSTDERFLELFAFPTSLTNGLIVAHGFGGILLMILAASLIGSEYGWGTLRTVLTKGTGRWSLLTAKLLLLAGLSVGVLIVATASVAVSSAIALATLDASWVSSSADWSGLGIGFGKAIYGMLPYVALAVFAAVVTSSSGAAISISLATTSPSRSWSACWPGSTGSRASPSSSWVEPSVGGCRPRVASRFSRLGRLLDCRTLLRRFSSSWPTSSF